MKKVLFFILILVVSATAISAEKVVPLTEPANPDSIKIENNRAYIVDFPFVYIYSLEDMKLLKKFGKRGEGPQEFPGYIALSIQSDYILVSSKGKISYFSKEGTFKKEVKTPIPFYKGVMPVGDIFIAVTHVPEKEILYRVVNRYDADFKELSQLYKVKAPVQRDKIELFRNTFQYDVYGKEIFIAGSDSFVIDVFNPEGTLVRTIRHQYDRGTISAEDKKKINRWLEIKYGDRYEVLKSRVVIPDALPAIKQFDVDVDEDRVYVISNKIKGGKAECYIFDLKGFFKRKVLITLYMENVLKAYPFTLNKGKLYQLYDNPGTDQWELHISDVLGSKK